MGLVTNDGLCLDGQRLRLTSGTYGAAGSTYQTELANFKNVTAFGAAGNGPAYFVVKDRNGTSYQYGNGGGAQVLASGTSTALTWLLNEVIDPAGNTIDDQLYRCHRRSGSCHNILDHPAVLARPPTTTRWCSPTERMSSKAPPLVTSPGTPIVNTNLLNSITINYSGAAVKKYVLSYQQSPTTGRDELYQLQECADSAATNCLLPTTFTYQNGTAGISTAGGSFTTSTTNWTLSNYDLNGDGYRDLL